MLLDIAYLIAWMLGVRAVQLGELARLDWHSHRGLSFLQLGLRELATRCYQGLPLPWLGQLPCNSPLPGCASKRKRLLQELRISFSRVTLVSA